MAFPLWLIRGLQGAGRATGILNTANKVGRKVPKKGASVADKVKYRSKTGVSHSELKQAQERAGGFLGGSRGYGGRAMRLGTTYGIGAGLGIFPSPFGGAEEQILQQPSTVQSYTPPPSALSEIESRMDFEKRKEKEMNKKMNKLLTYYGLVGLVNPDAAANMLKIGTGLVENDIASMGSERQAKIFDIIFKSGAVPQSPMEAYTTVLENGGTVEDAKEISGMIADAMPTGATDKTSQIQALYDEAAAYIQSGDYTSAKYRIAKGVDTGLFDAEGRFGAGQERQKVIDDIFNGLVEMIGGGPSEGMATGFRLVQ